MKKDTLVYFHKRKDTGEVFYVGIGDKKRPKSKRYRNQYWHNIVNKVGYTIEIIHTDLTWEDASKIEIDYIKQFGRADLGLGNLVNMTDGGEGNNNPSEEARKKMSVANLGKKHFLGKKHTKETKKLMSEVAIGHTFLTEESKKKISEFRKGKCFYNPTEEHKKKISQFHQGNTWWLGLNHTKETLQKMSLSQRGENHPSCKLTEEDVRNMRNEYEQGGITQDQLAKKYDISRGSVSAIIKRKRWTHI